MENQKLQGKRIAILATDGFEKVELYEPRKALEEAGAVTHLIAPEKESIRSWDFTDWGPDYRVDVKLEEAKSEEYDGVMIPGGVLNPDKLRMNREAVQFVTDFFRSGKPIASICHGPQILIETGQLQGRTMTSYPSLKTDLRNAGVQWVDQEVVTDRGLTTSRSPEDLPAFNRKIVEEFRGVPSEVSP